jgi:CheY-like chemotaxis protein
MLKKCLEAENCICEFAVNGDQAIEKVQRKLGIYTYVYLYI